MNWLRHLSTLGLLAVGGTVGLCATLILAPDEKPQDKKPAVTPEQAAFFESKVRPVLVAKCFGCHSDKKQSAGLRLDSLDAMKSGTATGAVLVPGDVEKSRLIHVIRYDGSVKMPPNGKLRNEEIAALTEWVKMGAPWTSAAPVEPAKAAAKTGEYVITPAQKRFWSFQPIVKATPPTVKNTAWVKSPIDRFVLAKLEAKGLTPAPPAAKRTLIRRAYFDLTGLPPTPEEVIAFVNDKSPDAFAKVVDRLLDSPHYGERWGRHWLDVVRYADSNGLDENLAFGNAYHYRDYVVNAFNKDKPYDVFLHEQLAGDLMPTDDEALRNERITATGFLALGAKVLAEQDKPKLVMDIVDEQIEVTSKAFLGLTVACARCHDHKFDPIPTKDYYALAGIFKSTRTMKDLGFVSKWYERPLMSKELQAKFDAYQTTLKPLEADVKAAATRANENLQSLVWLNTGKYLMAGWELSRQTGEISLAEAPAKPNETRLTVEAEKYTRGNAGKDFETYGKGIGVIHTVASPTFAEWDVEVPAAGTYQIELRYAALESRPVSLLVNGKLLRADAAGSTTGSWEPDTQHWEPQGIVCLNAGKNTIRLERADAIPHIDKLFLVAVPNAPAFGRTPKSLSQIAKQYGLIPEVVKRWGSYLQSVQANDPVFGKWIQSPTEALANEYGKAFLDLAPTKRSARQVTYLADDLVPTDAAARKNLTTLLYGKNGLLTLPKKPESFYTKADQDAVKKANDALKEAQAKGPEVPTVMAVEEGKPENVRVHHRGSTLNLGDEVSRHFLTVVSEENVKPIESNRSGRLELADWLTNPHHPLTSRVAINRIWQWHFGEGLMKTPDNWGLLGDKPSHPELLDWLAATFREQGWSMKKMHRLIMLSSTYQMSDANSPNALTVDPDNRLLWRMNRRRLEAEPFRDAMLFVSGNIDLTLGGSLLTTKNADYVTNDQSGNGAKYTLPRRSIYLPIIRNALYDMFQAFDVGDPSTVTAKRATTTIAPQALFVMNSPFALEQAKGFAKTLLAAPVKTDAERIRLAYLKAFARSPEPQETTRALEFMTQYGARLAATVPEEAKRREQVWASFCQVLYAANEFIYLD